MRSYYARPDRARKPRTAAARRAASASREAVAIGIAGLLVAWLAAGPAAAAEASAWDRDAHAQARLIEGAADPALPGARLAGLEIRLDPAFITYWRDPGDAGVPPTFDFAGSTNLRSAEVLYPAPQKLDEAGATAFGYTGDVTFPIVVMPADPARPVGLRVAMAYAVCHDICLPARARLAIALDGTASAEASRVADARAAVPRTTALGRAVDGLAIDRVMAGAGGVAVEAEAPAGATLFVEAPEPFAFEAAAPVPGSAGRLVFPVKRVDGGAEAPLPPLTLTLVAPGEPARAITVGAKLDGAAKTP